MTLNPGDIEISETYDSGKEKRGDIEKEKAGQCMNQTEIKMSVWQRKKKGEPRERKQVVRAIHIC